MSQARETDPVKDNDLVEQAREGSQGAFRELYDRYQARISRMVGSMVGSRDDADDIVQEVFVRAFRSLDRFKGQSAFYTWLYRIAVNAVTDYRRKRGRRREKGLDEPLPGEDAGPDQLSADEGLSPDNELYRKELAGMIDRALGTLSDEHREVMVLREINGLSYQEIAEITGLNIGTVMSRLHYARRKIADTLQSWNLLESGK